MFIVPCYLGFHVKLCHILHFLRKIWGAIFENIRQYLYKKKKMFPSCNVYSPVQVPENGTPDFPAGLDIIPIIPSN